MGEFYDLTQVYLNLKHTYTYTLTQEESTADSRSIKRPSEGACVCNTVCSPEKINLVCGMMMMSGGMGLWLRYFRRGKKKGIDVF